MNHWLLLSTNGKTQSKASSATYINALTETALMALLEEPIAMINSHERPSRVSTQAIQAKGCRLAMCPGGPSLDPQFTFVWLWAEHLQSIGITTLVPAASGLVRERIGRGSTFGSSSLAASVCDLTTQEIIYEFLGARPTFVGQPALVLGLLARDQPRDETVVISMHPNNREKQVHWYSMLLHRTRRPVRILVHDDKEWAHAGQLASAAPWAQIVHVRTLTTLDEWARALGGAMFLGANEAEVIGAAAMGVRSAYIVPTQSQELNPLNKASVGLLQLSQATMFHGDTQLDPQLVIDHTRTIPYAESSAQIQRLREWLSAAGLPLRPMTSPPVGEPEHAQG